MHPLLVEARSASLARRIRNAIVRTCRKLNLTAVRGACGYYDSCGATWTGWYQTQGPVACGMAAHQVMRLNRTRGRVICPICAFLQDHGHETRAGGDVEEMFASILDLHTHEVVGFLQGWDLDPIADAEDIAMYKMGRKLSRELVTAFVSDVD